MKKISIIVGVMSMVLSADAASLTWVGGTGTNFETAANWSPAQAPNSGNDSIDFAATSDQVSITSEFTIGSGQTFTGGNTFRIGNGGDVTVATGGSLNFGSGIWAEGGAVGQRFTIEAGATAQANQWFNETGYTIEFVANAAGVTTFDVSQFAYLRAGTLEVDLTNYDIANGTTLVLINTPTVLYDPANTGQSFGTVTLTDGWSGTIDYNYDDGEGTTGIALTNIIPEPSTYALLGGLLALGYVMVRRRSA